MALYGLPYDPKPRASRLGKIIWAVGVILLLLAMSLFIYLRRADSFDDHGCLIGLPVPEHIVVLLDRTDDFSPSDAAIAQRTMDRRIEAMPQFGRISVYEIDAGTAEGARLLDSRCAPRNADTKSFWAQLAGRPTKDRAKWEKEFKQSIDKVLDEIRTSKTSKTSPIMEGLFHIAAQEFAGSDALSKELIVYSDLFEYQGANAQMDFYRGPLSWPAIETRVRNDRMLAALNGVKVTIFMLPRSKFQIRQSGDLRALWESYFQETGARSVDWSPK